MIYKYYCKSCNKEWTEVHGFSEIIELCPFCESATASKSYTKNEIENFVKNDLGTKNKKPGAKTRAFIEESRQNLKEYKEEQKK